MMNNSYINIGGEELELRKISAKQYLAARLEAELMGEAFAEDELGKSVLLGASLLAEGLFFDGQRVFSSMEDVLDAMSADEIVLAAGFIDIDPIMKTKLVEDMKKIEAVNKEIELFVDEKKADSYEAYDNSVRGSVRESGGVKKYQNNTLKSSAFYTEIGFSPRNDMRQVSDFFQRDSRRYDGNISGF